MALQTVNNIRSFNLAPISNTYSDELELDDVRQISKRLDLEYRGVGFKINTQNISAIVTDINVRRKLLNMAMYQNLAQPVIDTECQAYAVAPTRTFTTSTGRRLAKRHSDYLTQLYDSLMIDMWMQKFERYTKLMGTVFAYPRYIEAEQRWVMRTLYPSDETFDYKTSPYDASYITEVSREYQNEDGEAIVIIYNSDEIIEMKKDTEALIDVEPHSFGFVPFAPLRFDLDNRTPLGTPSVELYDLCRHRSLVMANIMAQLHLSDNERYAILGAGWEQVEEAFTGPSDKLVAFEPQAVGDGDQVIVPQVQQLTPSGDVVATLFDTWTKVLHEWLQHRGHAPKPYTKGGDVISFETYRLANGALFRMQQENKKFLQRYERELLKRVVAENNRYSGNQRLPDDIKVDLDFGPDANEYQSAKDKLIYWEGRIGMHTATAADAYQEENPETSYEEAQQVVRQKAKENAEFQRYLSGLTGQQVEANDNNTDTDESDDSDGVTNE